MRRPLRAAFEMSDFDDIPDIPPSNGSLAPGLDLSREARLRGAPPTRAELAARRRAALALSGAWLAVQFWAFGVRPDLARVPAWYLLGLIAAPLAAGLLAIVVSTRPGKLGLGLRPALIVALSVAIPLAFFAAGVLLPKPYANGEPGNLMFGAYCLNCAVAWALLPILSAGPALRGAFAAGASWRSALLGAGCGLVAAALFTLHCPVVGKAHVVLAHGGAVLVSALIGAVLLVRATRA